MKCLSLPGGERHLLSFMYRIIEYFQNLNMELSRTIQLFVIYSA